MPQNPASIPSATSLVCEWLAKAITGHSILTLSGWWAGGQGFQAGTGGLLCYQGQSQILEAWESVTWLLLVVTHTCNLLANLCVPDCYLPEIPNMIASTKVKVREKLSKTGRTPKDGVAWWYFIHNHRYMHIYTMCIIIKLSNHKCISVCWHIS